MFELTLDLQQGKMQAKIDHDLLTQLLLDREMTMKYTDMMYELSLIIWQYKYKELKELIK